MLFYSVASSQADAQTRVQALEAQRKNRPSPAECPGIPHVCRPHTANLRVVRKFTIYVQNWLMLFWFPSSRLTVLGDRFRTLQGGTFLEYGPDWRK